MDVSILEELGFTKAQVKVYIALLELGVSTAGPILDKTSLQNSVVHMTLRNLVEKGLITYIIKGKVKHYQAISPQHLVSYIDNKKKQVEDLVPELLLRQKGIEKQEAQIYEGFRGFQTAAYDLINNAKKGEEFLFFAFTPEHPDDHKQLYTFFSEYEKERKKKGIITKGVAPSHLRDNITQEVIPKITFVDYPIPTNIMIFGNKIVFISWEDKLVSFLIESRQLTQSFKRYFKSI